MDRELWQLLNDEIFRAVRGARKRLGPEKKVRYLTLLIVRMYCWCVWHDRPLCWACDRGHYGWLFRPRGPLPGVSQFCRRIKSDRVQLVLQLLHEQLARPGLPAQLSYLDGKLLPVAMHSKDEQARKVRTNSGYVRGYRLHAWVTEDGRIVVWSVTPANAGEQTVAEAMCPHLPPQTPDALTVADVRYDSATLYAAVARTGGALLTVPQQGLPTVARVRQRTGPARLAAVQAWEGDAAPLARMAMRCRPGVERIFSMLTCTAGGLGPLPAWVRSLQRVRRWVGVKVMIHNARLALRRRAAA